MSIQYICYLVSLSVSHSTRDIYVYFHLKSLFSVSLFENSTLLAFVFAYDFKQIRNFGRNCLTLFNWERTTSFMSEKEILKTKKKRDELVITFIHIKSTKIFD